MTRQHRAPRGATVPVLAAGAGFLAMLDTTVTNLAVPDLRHDFSGSPVGHLTWIITLYFVMFAALLAPAGRLADLISRRTLFQLGVGLFSVMSLICALAPTLPTLIAGRGLQGAAAAAMIPASLALLLYDTEPARRAGAIGLWSAAGAFAAAIGPSLGGWLVDAFGWRSLFLINVPIGLAMVAATTRLPQTTESQTARTPAEGSHAERSHAEGSHAEGGQAEGVQSFGGHASLVPQVPDGPARVRDRRWPDLVGTGLLGGGVGAIALGVTQSQDWGWDGRTIGFVVGGAVSVALAVWRSTRHPVPALEVSLWRNRTFAVANVASALYGATLFPWLLVGVLVLTQLWDYSLVKAGLAMTPGAVAATVAAIVMGRLTARIGVRPAVTGGALVLVASAVWIKLALSEQPQFLELWLPAGLVLGAGMGAVTTGTASAAALSVRPERFAGATGLNTTARQLGGALGIAVLAALVPAQAGLSDYRTVYIYCAITSAGTALAGLWLTIRAPRTAQHEPAPTAPKEVVR